jgi:hypothetical protein
MKGFCKLDNEPSGSLKADILFISEMTINLSSKTLHYGASSLVN